MRVYEIPIGPDFRQVAIWQIGRNALYLLVTRTDGSWFATERPWPDEGPDPNLSTVWDRVPSVRYWRSSNGRPYLRLTHDPIQQHGDPPAEVQQVLMELYL